MLHLSPLPPRHGIQAHRMNTVEYAPVHLRRILLKPLYKLLHLLTLGAHRGVAGTYIFREPACTLQKIQAMMIFPGDYILLMHLIHRTNKLHPLKVITVELRKHPLQL